MSISLGDLEEYTSAPLYGLEHHRLGMAQSSERGTGLAILALRHPGPEAGPGSGL